MSLTRTVLSRVLPASARFATPVSGFTGFRHNSGSPAGSGEAHLIDTLRKRFPGATDIQVVDISGGCGSMFEVFVEAGEFKGLRHRNLKSWKENALMHAGRHRRIYD
jgi:hypothetical protein